MQVDMNKQIGAKYQNDICEDCKLKVAAATNNLTKWDMIRPRKTANKFLKLLCKDCKKNMIKKLRGK